MKNHRWVAASIFVWTLAGAVALAAYSGRNQLVILDKPEHDHASHAGQPHVDEAVAPAANQAKLTSIAWEESFEKAMQRAKAENKPLLVDVYATWCGPCKLMDQEVYTDPDVIAQSANWVAVKIDGEKRPDVAQAYGVTGYPTILFVANSGKPFATIVGYEAAPSFAQSMREAFGKWNAA